MKFKYPKWHRMSDSSLKKRHSSAHKSGLPPGSLVHIGDVHSTVTTMTLTRYHGDELSIQPLESISQLLELDLKKGMTWVNIDGLNETGIIEFIGQQFNIHPLVLEDILSTHQRPKLEEEDNYLYLVVKAVSAGETEELTPKYHQISLLALDNLLFTFKEKNDELFTPIRHRLQNPKGRLRQLGVDYLTYAILDCIIDEYFVVEDRLDDIIDPLEESLLEQPADDTLHIIQNLRRQLITMKRNIVPVRELLTDIQHSDSHLLTPQTERFFADVFDHVVRVCDSIDSYRERITAVQETYLTLMSNKMNETMKVLTIFASIFIPLTFIAGIYGMNFEYMPELAWKWAYPTLWGLFIVITVALLIYFKRKRWL